jgi:hypothetical protein
MNKDDQRVRETVQAELRRRRGALDRSEEHFERAERAERSGALGTTNGHNGHNGHAIVRPPAEERRQPLRRQWSLAPGTPGTPPGTPPGTTGE